MDTHQPELATAPQPAEGGKSRVRRGLVVLVLALVLLILGVLLYAWATPNWEPDGSRPAWATTGRVAMTISLALGTLMIPLGLRELILALVPNSLLAVALGLAIGLFGMVVVPIEIWTLFAITSELEPGARERYEASDEWDWD